MRRPATIYGAALTALVAALLLRWLLDPLMGESLPLVTMFGAVAVAVWVGGYRPAMLVGVLGYVACAYLFIAPRGSLGLDRIANVIGLLAYTLTCSVIIAFGESMRIARRRSETARADRTQAEAALRRSESDLSDFFENAAVGLHQVGPDGTILRVNQTELNLLGYVREEYVGRHIADFHVDRPVIDDILARLARGEEVHDYPARLRCKDGSIRDVLINSNVLFEDGEFIHTRCLTRDVTAQRHAADELRKGEERLRMALAAARSVAWELDPWTGELAVSGNAAEVLGLPPDSTLEHGAQGFALIHPDDVERHRSIVDKAVEECGSYISQYRILRQDTGGLQWLEDRGHGVRERPGDPVRLIGVVTDVSERRDTEDKLRRSAELLTFVIDRSPTGFYIVDADFRISHINADSQARAFRNVSPAIGRRLDEAMRILWPEPLATEIIAIFRHTLDTGEPYRSPGLVSRRNDLDAVETYEWQLDRIALPDGTFGVVCYYYDTTQLREAEQLLRDSEMRLRASADELTEADRRKDEFLATLAHELRNPLAPLRNGLEVMRLAGANAAAVEQARTMMERQLAQMVHLVDDLLDVSRVSRGKLELRKQRVDLTLVLGHAVETSRPVIESNGHLLDVDVATGPILVDADVTRLAQAFGNLLNNAAKFSDRGSRISLTAARQGDEVVIRVKDAGVGIPLEMLPRVFDMFTQVDRSLERSQGGLGIGLTLVKRLVDLHGGNVEAHSDGDGMGSEFVVRLPVVSPASRAAERPAGMGESAFPSGPCRILVADDNVDAATSLAIMLRTMGHEVRTVSDGLQAVEVAAVFEPDVILLDIGMPKLNGYEACRRIREQPPGEKAVLVALTGWGQDEDKRRSQEAGFHHHLVKPVDPAALEKLLASSKPAPA